MTYFIYMLTIMTAGHHIQISCKAILCLEYFSFNEIDSLPAQVHKALKSCKTPVYLSKGIHMLGHYNSDQILFLQFDCKSWLTLHRKKDV